MAEHGLLIESAEKRTMSNDSDLTIVDGGGVATAKGFQAGGVFAGHQDARRGQIRPRAAVFRTRLHSRRYLHAKQHHVAVGHRVQTR